MQVGRTELRVTSMKKLIKPSFQEALKEIISRKETILN